MKLVQQRERALRLAGRSAGFSLTEISIAVTLFAIMAGGVVLSLTRAKYLSWTNRERSIALEAAQSEMERVRGELFEEAFRRFNATAADDLPGPPIGTPSPGKDFAVPGLTPQAGDPDGFAGEILFPGDGVQLSEAVNDVDWGLPRDLNLDGDETDLISGTEEYFILPIRVRVAWQGPEGNQQVVLTSYLVNRQ